MVGLTSNIQLNTKLLNPNLLDEIPLKPTMVWLPFSKKEFKNAINKCNNLSSLGLDHIT